jgi:hypothetical protein
VLEYIREQETEAQAQISKTRLQASSSRSYRKRFVKKSASRPTDVVNDTEKEVSEWIKSIPTGDVTVLARDVDISLHPHNMLSPEFLHLVLKSCRLNVAVVPNAQLGVQRGLSLFFGENAIEKSVCPSFPLPFHGNNHGKKDLTSCCQLFLCRTQVRLAV